MVVVVVVAGVVVAGIVVAGIAVVVLVTLENVCMITSPRACT